MSNIVKLKRKPRKLQASYSETEPYKVSREDQDDGTIVYVVRDERPESFRDVCSTDDDGGTNPYAKVDAEQIARGLNMLVQYGLERLPVDKAPWE